MKKLLALFLGIAFVLFPVVAYGAGPTTATSTAWTTGNTISSAWLNAVGSFFSTLSNQVNATNTPLGTISAQATTTGNILVASSSNGWVALAVGTNGQCPIASSGAPLGIAWGTCGGSINGTLASAYYLAASGTGLSVLTSGATTTYTINPASYLQPSNNFSELTNTSTARVNIGLGNVLNGQQLLAGNNLTDLTNTSTARNALGYSSSSQITITSTGTIQFASNNVSQFTNDAGYVTSTATGLTPGMIMPYVSSTAPSGWLICDGTQYATATYPNLFTLIGYTYGGSTSTFGVPNMQGRFVAGPSSTLSTTLGATGGSTSTVTTDNVTDNFNSPSGKYTGVGSGYNAVASTNNNTSTASIIPPYIIENYIIKF